MKHSLNTRSILGKFVLNIVIFENLKKVSNSSHIWLKYRVIREFLELRSVSSSMLCILTFTSWDTILLFSKAGTFSKMAKRLNGKIINKICAG